MSEYTIAQRMLDAAICVYSIAPNEPFEPDPLYKNPMELEGDPTVFMGGKYDIDAGFVATTKLDAKTNEKWVVLSFRGTLGTFHWNNWESILAFIKDWFQDDETKMVPFEVQGELLGKVEEGFSNALTAVWPQIQESLDKIDWSSVSGIQITGHSKGAAMTFLAAAMVKVYYPAAKSINVHAFAAPLAGDPTFAQWYRENNLDTTTTRYQRLNDIVPFVPPSESWDLFKNLPGTLHPKGLILEAALKLLGLQAHGGYEEVGQLIALVTEDPSDSKVVGGEDILREGIQHSIALGEGDLIASAHSAIDSYWPALFKKASS